jgi:uncharacterized membrane-anchored protein YitT (DUF2179 family)
MPKTPFFNKYGHLVKTVFGVIASAIVYTISIKAFIRGSDLLTGGASGVAMIISRVFFGDSAVAFSVLYVLINIPLFILAFRELGKIFAISSMCNVLLASLLISLIPDGFFSFINLGDDVLTIALFAGIFTGLSTGIALKFDTSAGGVDILGAYISVKKDVKIGKYIFLINAGILIVGGILFQKWVAMLYTAVYIYVSSVVVNIVHKRNNKKLIKIVTNKEKEVSSVLVQNSLHGCTIIKGEGGYTKQARYIIETVVSENEVKNLLTLIYQTDPDAFTTISNVDMVKGKFYLPPIH